MPAKHPYMEFYPGDWLKDTACLKGEHKGIWISLIVDLWQTDGEGQYTVSDVASISSVTVDAARSFLATAQRRGLATLSGKVDAAIDGDVDAVFTIICRRIKREKKALAMHVSRQLRYKQKATVDGMVDAGIDAALTVQKSEVRSQKSLTEKKQKAAAPRSSAVADPLPDNLKTDQFRQAWDDWFAYRRENKLRVWKQRTIDASLSRLSSWGHDAAIASIKQSIENGWHGLFEPKNGNGASTNGPYLPKAKTKAVRICTLCRMWADECVCEGAKRGTYWKTVEIPSDYTGDRALGAARELTERRP